MTPLPKVPVLNTETIHAEGLAGNDVWLRVHFNVCCRLAHRIIMCEVKAPPDFKGYMERLTSAIHQTANMIVLCGYPDPRPLVAGSGDPYITRTESGSIIYGPYARWEG